MFSCKCAIYRDCSTLLVLTYYWSHEQLHRFDHILLETTGLANPGPVASILWVDDQLESPVRLDSIITVRFKTFCTCQEHCFKDVIGGKDTKLLWRV